MLVPQSSQPKCTARGGLRSSPLSVAFFVLLAGCSLEALPVAGAGAGGAGGDGSAGGSVPPTCPPEHVPGPDGECMAVGIRGCAELFIDEADGLCRPSMDKCPVGMIPKFDEGCVPVGIPPSECPAVFMEEDGLCHPSMSKCPDGTFAAPLLGCVPIDGEQGCGSGTWGHIAPGPDTVWVDPSYADGEGDGSQDKPLGTIADALAVVPDGGRVALAAGNYDEPVYLNRPVEIVGRCPSLVTISGVQPTSHGLSWLGSLEEAIVLVEATTGAALGNVTLNGPGHGLIAVSAEVSLSSVHIREASVCGILARDLASVSVERCLVERTAPAPGNSRGGLGLYAVLGAEASIADSAFSQNRTFGLRAEVGGAQLVGTGVLVEGTETDGYYGDGVAAIGEASVELSSSAMRENHVTGVFGWGQGAELRLSACLIEDTLPVAGEHYGAFFGEASGAWVTACAALRNGSAGLHWGAAHGEGRGNLARDNELMGISTDTLSVVSLVDNAAVANRGTGIRMYRAGAGALMARNLAEGNGLAEAGHMTWDADGISLFYCPHGVMRDNAVLGNYGNGLVVGQAQALVEHNLVEQSLGTDACPRRHGEGMRLGGALSIVELAGNAVLGNAYRGIWAFDGIQIAASRNLVADTLPRASDGELGCGLVVEGGAALSGDGLVFARNHVAGALVLTASLDLSSSRFEDTREGSFTGLLCPVQPCPWNVVATHHGIADGLIAAGSTVHLSEVRAKGCSRAGLLFHGCEGSVSDVVSAHNGFGLVLQGLPRPVVGESCKFDPSSEQDVLTDGELAIPNAATDLPGGA